MEKALQWWYTRKLRQLESEANLIREQLLQESFAMRRSLEVSSDRLGSCTASHQKYIEQLENFHSSLKQLSDRLYPPYQDEGLPFALQYSVERWQEELPKCQFKLNLPSKWQQKSSADDFIVLNILEDILSIQKTNVLLNNLIAIELEQNSSISKFDLQLKVIFVGERANNSTADNTYAEENTDGTRQELQYLQQIFEDLTSGRCSNILSENSYLWLFEW